MREIEQGRSDARAGFTLIEALAALTVLAVVLVSLLEAYAGGLRLIGSTVEYGEARILANSVLAEAVSAKRLRPHLKRGRNGRFSWLLSVRELQEDWSEISSEAKWQLYRVRVSVSWPRNRSMELETLKIGRRDE